MPLKLSYLKSSYGQGGQLGQHLRGMTQWWGQSFSAHLHTIVENSKMLMCLKIIKTSRPLPRRIKMDRCSVKTKQIVYTAGKSPKCHNTPTIFLQKIH